MQNLDQQWRRLRLKSLLYAVLLAVVCVLLNLGLARLATALSLPLYLDSIGTVLAAAIGGYLPGIAVGYASNLLISINDPVTAYYSCINVLLAFAVVRFNKRDVFSRFPSLLHLWLILTLTLIGGGLGSVLTWLIYGFETGEGISGPLTQQFVQMGFPGAFFSQLSADLVIDLADKTITVLLCTLIIRAVPKEIQLRFRPVGWRQAPLTAELSQTVGERKTRVTSLRRKLVMLVAVGTLLVALASTGVSVLQYRRTTIQEHTKLGKAVTGLMLSSIDPERVDDCLAYGEEAEGYRETMERLSIIRESSPDIEYVYVYRILPDGCHVVFDVDTPELPGASAGDIIPFDESFAPYIDTLLDGGEIEPLITNDTYGWLLTVYQPIYNAKGECVCYAAADISMGQLTMIVLNYCVRAVALFLGLFLLILGLSVWIAEYSVVMPINAMSLAAESFAYNSEEARSESLEHIQDLKISTGDEIENLYTALIRTTEDSVRYIGDVQQKNKTISRMQNGLILVLADMVESRDQCTGDHVRKTAAYVRIIMEQMRREGIYADRLTKEYIRDVVHSAPLHDIGKIHVSDALLNKPGKLTPEEFKEMQSHTVAGGEIISHAIALVSDAGYLAEAKNLATYHHERWDGKGYPTGLAGEDIPLSARVMAVADVFDALVSRRSYKEPFPFEKALEIIREESGTHFDPLVTKAFFDAEAEVRRVADGFMDKNEGL